MVDFTADSFNVQRSGYKRFIEKLRQLVAVRYSHGLAVLPDEENPPTRFFDIPLQTNIHSIRLRLRRDNLYLVGYQMQDSDQWLELRYDDNHPVHRITNSIFLGFGDTYGQLLGAIRAPGSTQAIPLTAIQAGRQPLIDAVNSLATSVDDRSRARSLIVVIVMIAESVRFNAITDHFVGTAGATSAQIPLWIDDYVRGWATLSASLLNHDADNSFRLPAINNFGNIRSFLEAVLIMGTLKGYYFGHPRGKRLLLRAADDGENSVYDQDYPSGRPLVELFSVTIDFIHGANQNFISDIYGKIQVSDGLGDVYVYNRDTNGSESVRAGETILLNGPARCISAYDSFTIDVTLMRREVFSEDDEISKGKILWEVTNYSTNEYDKLLFQEVKGRYGLATLSYAVLSDAVEAMVEVMLIENTESDSANVYGLLTSHNVNLDSESVFFRKASNRFIRIKCGELFPLLKSVVAVPMNSNFILRADLKGSNIFSSDDEIALGTATFHPQLSGIDEKEISGKNGKIQVKVTWAWYVGP